MDALLNYETVKSFGAEGRAVAGYDEALLAYAEAAVKANTSLVMLNVVQAAIMSLGLAAMAVMAGMDAAAGRIEVGAITTVTLTMMNIYAPLNILGFAYREIRQSIIDMEAMVDLWRQKPAVADAPHARPLPPADARGAELVFDRVGFRHSARAQGLVDVSFHAAPGLTVAVVGPSGAGKSTLVRLAMRLIDPQEGAVLLDGCDLRDLTQISLRSAVALVPQDVALFNDTIRVNIGFGRPDANDQEVWAAADAAELGDFIRGLPDGNRHQGGRAGPEAVRRRTSAGGSGPRPDRRSAPADSRRSHKRLGQPNGVGDPGHLAARAPGKDHPGGGPPTFDRGGRGSYSGDQGRPIVEQGDHAALLDHDGEYAALWRRQTRRKT